MNGALGAFGSALAAPLFRFPVATVDTVNLTGNKLVNLSSESFDAGARVYVASRAKHYTLTQVGVTADNDVYVTALNKSGYMWIGDREYDAKNAAQTAWFVNTTTGDNDNTGITSGAPLKTVSEVARRMHAMTLGADVVLTLTGDMATTDLPSFSYRMHPSTAYKLKILGAVTTVATGTLTAHANASAPPFIDDYNIEDAAIATSWAALGAVATAGFIIKRTSGTVAYAHGAKAYTSKIIRTSVPMTDGGAVAGIASTWANDDAYAILALPKVRDIRFIAEGGGGIRFDLCDIRWATADFTTNGVNHRSEPHFVRCTFGTTTRAYIAGAYFENCAWYRGAWGADGFGSAASGIISKVQLLGGLLTAGPAGANYAFSSCTLVLGNSIPIVFQGARVRGVLAAQINTVNIAVYDVAVDPMLELQTFSKAVVTYISGNGNTGTILLLGTGCKVSYANTPSFVDDCTSIAAGTQFNVKGTTSATAGLPFAVAASDAGIFAN